MAALPIGDIVGLEQQVWLSTIEATIVRLQRYYRAIQRKDWWPTLLGIAEQQGGLITAAQARLAGAARPQLLGLVDRGVLDRVQHGVYQLSGSPVGRWTDVRAAWLAIAPERTAGDRLAGDDPEGVVSHRSAALLFDLGDVAADQIEFTCDSRRRTRNPGVRIHRGQLSRSDWTVREGLPVTTPVKTIQMLAADGLDLGHLAGIVRDTILRHDVPLDEVAHVLDDAAGKYGYPEGNAFVHSLLETVGVPVSAVDLVAAAAAKQLREAIAVLMDRQPELLSPAAWRAIGIEQAATGR